MDRIIREPECRQLTGLSRTTRWQLERRWLFPARRRLSANSVGWLESELHAWIRTRETRRQSARNGVHVHGRRAGASTREDDLSAAATLPMSTRA